MRNQMEPPCVQSRLRKTSSRANEPWRETSGCGDSWCYIVCFSCRILKFEVCAQVAAESPECPANTVLVLFWWLTQHPACQVTQWGWPNKQHACGVCVCVCMPQHSVECCSSSWRRGKYCAQRSGGFGGQHRNNRNSHPTTYLVGLCCKQRSIYQMYPKWSVNESRWGSSFTEDKQERGGICK